MEPILVTEDRWKEIITSVVEMRGGKYRLSFVQKRDLGWTGRYHPNNHSRVFVDFWTEDAKSMFLLEFGTEGIVKEVAPKPRRILHD